MDIKNRTLTFISSKKLSVKQFEELCDLSNGYVSSMRKGFGTQKLENVLNQFPELNREWLLFGEGEMLKDSSGKAKSTQVEYEKLPSGSSMIEFLMDQNRSLERIVHDQNDIIKTQLQRITDLEAELDRAKNASTVPDKVAGCAAAS